jgi:hypothetical protein
MNGLIIFVPPSGATIECDTHRLDRLEIVAAQRVSDSATSPRRTSKKVPFFAGTMPTT